MKEKFRLNKEGIALRAAKEVRDGMCVNLGFGTPTLVSNYLAPGTTAIFQSENGVVGYGPMTSEAEADWDLVNAAGQPLTMVPGISFVDHAESFAMIRGGHIDVAILGGLQVSERGDLASWVVPGEIGGMGGAMDLAVHARKLVITMTHTTETLKPKILERCAYPLTGARCVHRIITDIAVIDVTEDGLVLREIAPEWTPVDVQELTEPRLIIAKDLKLIEL